MYRCCIEQRRSELKNIMIPREGRLETLRMERNEEDILEYVMKIVMWKIRSYQSEW